MYSFFPKKIMFPSVIGVFRGGASTNDESEKLTL
jgi:hypothetical protein